jgi:putative aldouronate transport system substrate-binding protein
MPSIGSVSVDVVKADGKSTEKVTKEYDKAGNIVATMNAALAKGKLSGVDAVNMLRDYIDKAYNGYYGTKRSDLFIGQNAAWDADELVALLRCVVANPQTLNGTDNVEGIFSREDANNQRRVDLYKLAGILFGVRGMESRSDYLYVGADGQLHDARLDEVAYTALERMNALAKEGLISESFINNSAETSSTMLENDLGFMSYDYNQTQTIMNETKLNKNGQTGEKYMAVMVPVARWFDGTNENGVYMRFTESWRSVKTDAWAISVKGVDKDENKLYAALALIDYAYSEKGQILMSYGPDAFIKTNADGSYVTFSFNGKDMPVISDATYDALWKLASGNYTNFARQYLGSTLSFVKSQAFEYQCTHEVGREGASKISTAIGLGTIKHPELAITSNPWYTSVPTVLPNTTVETDLLNSYTEITDAASGYFGSGKGQNNLFVNIIAKGYAGDSLSTRADVLSTVTNTWNGKTYLALKQQAWKRLTDFYNSDIK